MHNRNISDTCINNMFAWCVCTESAPKGGRAFSWRESYTPLALKVIRDKIKRMEDGSECSG